MDIERQLEIDGEIDEAREDPSLELTAGLVLDLPEVEADLADRHEAVTVPS